MAKITTYDILNLDMEAENNKTKIQKALRKIKPFQNIPIEEDIDISLLEKYISLCERKYAIMIGVIYPTFVPDEKNIWRATIKRTDTGRYLNDVCGSSLYELLCKLCILYYSEIKSGIEEKDWDGLRDRRLKQLRRAKGFKW